MYRFFIDNTLGTKMIRLAISSHSYLKLVNDIALIIINNYKSRKRSEDIII